MQYTKKNCKDKACDRTHGNVHSRRADDELLLCQIGNMGSQALFHRKVIQHVYRDGNDAPNQILHLFPRHGNLSVNR